MTLITCPACTQQVSDRAATCPKCGHPHRGAFYCYEYKSDKTLFGLPLVHIVLGPAIDPATGNLRIAKGIIAIGGIAVGWLALGGIAVGLIAFGGLALGLAAVGGLAAGLGFAAGGLAVGIIAVAIYPAGSAAEWHCAEFG